MSVHLCSAAEKCSRYAVVILAVVCPFFIFHKLSRFLLILQSKRSVIRLLTSPTSNTPPDASNQQHILSLYSLPLGFAGIKFLARTLVYQSQLRFASGEAAVGLIQEWNQEVERQDTKQEGAKEGNIHQCWG